MTTEQSTHTAITADITPQPRTPKRKRTPVELLDDPSIVTVTVSQAAQILGISKSTAHKNYHDTGFLLNGKLVPVLVCGTRTIVSIEHLRAALNYPTPLSETHQAEIDRIVAARQSHK
jgi:hypothetical protein